jgi:ADP-ribose pyrophosphatase YjhB (NUDIX family)
MVTVEKKGKTFTYRVAAVIIDQGRVLLSRTVGDNFWSLPGGNVNFLEQANEVIQREIRDAFAEEINIERLLWVVENFFRDQKQRKQYHELGLYFLVTLSENSKLVNGRGPFSGSGAAYSQHLEYQWFPREKNELLKVPIYPLFLKYGLVDLPSETQHVINQDRSL